MTFREGNFAWRGQLAVLCAVSLVLLTLSVPPAVRFSKWVAGLANRVAEMTLRVVMVSGNEFAATLPTPKDVPWTNLVLRAWAIAEGESGLGVVTVPVKPRSHQ